MIALQRGPFSRTLSVASKGALAAAVALCVACGSSSSDGSGSGSGGTGTTGSSATNAQSFVSAYCAVFAPCCSAAKLPAPGTGCNEFFDGAETGATYDATKGAACLSDLQDLQKNTTLCSGGATPPSCENVFSPAGASAPTKNLGDACTADSQCIQASTGTTSCATNFVVADGSTDSMQTQTCQQSVVGKAGDGPCSGALEITPSSTPPTVYTCAASDNLYCDGTSLKCTTFKALGAACSGDSECGTGNYCPFNSMSPVCTAGLAIGAACTGDDTCTSGAFCDSTKMVCTANLALGAACTTSEQCGGSLTDGSLTCNNGVCATSESLMLSFICH